MNRPSLTTSRTTVQLLVVLAFIIIPILNRNRYSLVYGNFLAFHFFYIPLVDPLAALQLTVKNFYLTLDNIIGTLIPLAVAYYLGTVFCSWICPFGFFSHWTFRLSRRIFKKKYRGLPLAGKGFALKLTIFLLGFSGFLFFSSTPVLNQLSLPAWYARFFQYLFGQDMFSFCIFLLLAVLLIEFAARKRLWCRYICPQSILIGLAKQLNPNRLKVVYQQDRCQCKSGRDPCRTACTLGLEPKKMGMAIELECTNCGDCIMACNKFGQALNFKLGRGKEN